MIAGMTSVVLADLEAALASRARGRLWLDHLLTARQMLRQARITQASAPPRMRLSIRPDGGSDASSAHRALRACHASKATVTKLGSHATNTPSPNI
jgi:hypothetical protein